MQRPTAPKIRANQSTGFSSAAVNRAVPIPPRPVSAAEDEEAALACTSRSACDALDAATEEADSGVEPALAPTEILFADEPAGLKSIFGTEAADDDPSAGNGGCASAPRVTSNNPAPAVLTSFLAEELSVLKCQLRVAV
jgi:hypothetical protein